MKKQLSTSDISIELIEKLDFAQFAYQDLEKALFLCRKELEENLNREINSNNENDEKLIKFAFFSQKIEGEISNRKLEGKIEEKSQKKDFSETYKTKSFSYSPINDSDLNTNEARQKLSNFEKIFDDILSGSNDSQTFDSIEPKFFAYIVNKRINLINIEDLQERSDLFSKINSMIARGDYKNFSHFSLYADELFLRRYIEENLEQMFVVAQSPDINDQAFVILASLIFEQIDKLEDAKDKYPQIFEQILARFNLVFEDVNLQKKLENLKKQYYSTNDEEKKKEILGQIIQIESKIEMIKVLSLKSPEAFAKMLIDNKNINIQNLYNNLGKVDFAYFLNALGEKNPKMLSSLLNEIAIRNPEILNDCTKMLSNRNLENQKRLMPQNDISINDSYFIKTKDQNFNDIKNLNQNNGPDYSLLSKDEAWRLANQNQIFNFHKTQAALLSKDPNSSMLKSQMSFEQLQKNGLVPPEVKIVISKLRESGISVSGKDLEQIIKICLDRPTEARTIDWKNNLTENYKEDKKIANDGQKDQKNKVDTFFFNPAEAERIAREYINYKDEERKREEYLQKYKKDNEIEFDSSSDDEYEKASIGINSNPIEIAKLTTEIEDFTKSAFEELEKDFELILIKINDLSKKHDLTSVQSKDIAVLTANEIKNTDLQKINKVVFAKQFSNNLDMEFEQNKDGFDFSKIVKQCIEKTITTTTIITEVEEVPITDEIDSSSSKKSFSQIIQEQRESSAVSFGQGL
jgi:hypothetical protein